MKAFRVVDFEKPAMFCDIPRQEPQHGQVELKIEACGLNFADLLMQKNQYQGRLRNKPFGVKTLRGFEEK